MIRKLHDKYGVINPDVSGAEVLDVLTERFPQLKFQAKLQTDGFVIKTRSGVAVLTIMRGRGAYAFLFRKDISLFYWLISFGLLGLFEGFAGSRDLLAIRTFLRERFHRPTE
jgi:hypothetical protein